MQRYNQLNTAMTIPPIDSFRNLRFHLGMGNTAKAPIPLVFDDESSPGGMAMIFTALAAVVLYGMEPGTSVALFFSTYGIAVYTTQKPGTRAWAVYEQALRSPSQERLTLLLQAQELAPGNHQIVFALGVTMAESGQYVEAMETFRRLDRQHPGHSAIEAALASTNRMLLAQAGMFR